MTSDDALDRSSSADAEVDPSVADRLRRMVNASRTVERIIGSTFHLHSTDMAALEVIGRERGVTPSRLAQQLGVTASAVTFVIDRLVEAGHVERLPHPHDRRSTVIRQVASSANAVGELMRPIGVQISAYYEGLTPQEQRTVDDFLDRVTEVFVTMRDPSA